MTKCPSPASITEIGAIALVKTIDVGIHNQLFEHSELQPATRAWDTVVLQNFNLAPQEAYGTELFELLTAQMMSDVDSPELIAVATYSTGLAGLPISPGIRRICICVDLDSPMPASIEADVTEWLHAIADDSEDDGAFRPWPAAVGRLARALRGSELQLDGEVLAILEKGLRVEPIAS